MAAKSCLDSPRRFSKIRRSFTVLRSPARLDRTHSKRLPPIWRFHRISNLALEKPDLVKITVVPVVAMLGMTADADITGAFSADSIVMAEQFGGGEIAVFVQDLYFISNDPNDVVLAAFDLLLEPTAQIDYYQAPLACGWNPGNIGGIFDTESVRRADSFVTIGGFGSDASNPLQIPGAGEDTQFDPNFGGPDTTYPGTAVGWFNSAPSTLAGAVHDTPLGTRGTFIGRFSYVGGPWDSPLYESRISASWNQGIGTPDESASFLINWIPAPAPLGLLAIAGLRGSSRRRD